MEIWNSAQKTSSRNGPIWRVRSGTRRQELKIAAQRALSVQETRSPFGRSNLVVALLAQSCFWSLGSSWQLGDSSFLFKRKKEKKAPHAPQLRRSTPRIWVPEAVRFSVFSCGARPVACVCPVVCVDSR